jgi:hypothetical protein
VWRGQAEHLADSLSKGDRSWSPADSASAAGTPPKATSARSPSSRPTRSAPPSSGPRPRPSAQVSAATATGALGGSGRPNAGRLQRRAALLPTASFSGALGFGRGHRLAVGLCRGPRCRSLSVPCSSWHWYDRTVGRNVLGTVMAQAPRHG